MWNKHSAKCSYGGRTGIRNIRRTDNVQNLQQYIKIKALLRFVISYITMPWTFLNLRCISRLIHCVTRVLLAAEILSA